MRRGLLRRALQRSGLGLLPLLLVSVSCDGSDPVVPEPAESALVVHVPPDAEPAVRDAIHEALDAAMSNPSAATLLRLGRVLHAHDRLNDAVDAYCRAGEQATTDTERMQASYLAGVAALDFEPTTARRELTRAEAIDAAYPVVKLRLARLDEREGQHERARSRYEQVLERVESAHAELGLARLALADDELDEALRRVDRALALREDFREAHATRSQVLAALGRADEARDAAARAASSSETTDFTDPFLQDVHREARSFTGLLLQANRHRAAGRNGPALIAVERALAVSPEHPDARLTRAALLTELRRTDEAAEVLADLLRQVPTFDGLAEAVRTYLRAAGRSSDVASFDTMLSGSMGSNPGPDGNGLATFVLGR